MLLTFALCIGFANWWKQSEFHSHYTIVNFIHLLCTIPKQSISDIKQKCILEYKNKLKKLKHFGYLVFTLQ